MKCYKEYLNLNQFANALCISLFMSEWISYPFCIYIQHRLNSKTNLHLRFNNRPEGGMNSTEFVI